MEIQVPLVLFTLFSGLSGGAMILLCLADFFHFSRKVARISCYVIAVTLAIGGIASIMHLAQQSHILSVLTHLGSFSGVSLELIGLMVSFVCVAIYWFFSRDGQSDTARRVFAVLCGIAGIVFCWIVGDSYVLAARPNWDTLLLPFGYWSSGVACGGIMYLTILAVVKDDAAHIKRMSLITLIETAIMLIGYLAYGIFVGGQALADNAVLFWVCEIVIGVCATAACLIGVYLGKDIRLVYVAMVCVLVGGVVFRCMMWILGNGNFPGLLELGATERGYIGW